MSLFRTACPMSSPSPLSPAAQAPHLLTLGLTGGIGSGKSKVAELFVERGAALVDTDEIAHRLTGPGGAAIPAIRAAFGDGVIAADGRMDRAAMRALVFSDPARRKQLEGILHPLIQATVHDELAQLAVSDPASRPPYVLVAVPLLVESGHWQHRVDRVLVVDCPEEVQVARVMARSGLADAQVRAIMAAQASRAQRLAVADVVIDNGRALDYTIRQINALHSKLLTISREH